jgi:hypothetical protein
MVRVLQYCGYKDVSETDKRMAETADTADIPETLEKGADANCEPDTVRDKPGASYSMSKYPEKLPADSRELDFRHNNHQPLFGSPGISKSGQAV